MIRIIGTRIIVMILLLIVANAAGAYATYEYLMPMKQQKETELSNLKSETQAKYEEVRRLKEQFVMLQAQLREFKDLEARGFFSNQNRVDAQASFDSLGKLSGLLKTRFQISAGQRIDDPLATDANHVILKSPVAIEIESLDDVDVYTFLKALQERFPGSVDITDFSLNREQNITAPLLRQIGSGQPIKLVTAKVSFDWRTMANKDRLDEFDTSTSNGEQSEAAAAQAAPAGLTPQPVPGQPQHPVPQVVH